MYRNILCISTVKWNFLPNDTVTYAADFAEAKELIISTEAAGTPFTELCIPKRPIQMPLFSSSLRYAEEDMRSGNDMEFWKFLSWMINRGRRYAFSVYGISRENQFVAIRDCCRNMGFEFLD